MNRHSFPVNYSFFLSGVDDNGSGMAALLEAARALATSDITCPRLNSVAFVAFDWEEYVRIDISSASFLLHILLNPIEIAITINQVLAGTALEYTCT